MLILPTKILFYQNCHFEWHNGTLRIKSLPFVNYIWVTMTSAGQSYIQFYFQHCNPHIMPITLSENKWRSEDSSHKCWQTSRLSGQAQTWYLTSHFYNQLVGSNISVLKISTGTQHNDSPEFFQEHSFHFGKIRSMIQTGLVRTFTLVKSALCSHAVRVQIPSALSLTMAFKKLQYL